MRRHERTDEEFDQIKDLLPGREKSVGVTAQDNRLFVHAVIQVFKTGAPWRGLPERFSKWSRVHRRFSRWPDSGVFDKIFRILSADADREFLLMDGTIVKAHQHASGAQKKTSCLQK